MGSGQPALHGSDSVPDARKNSPGKRYVELSDGTHTIIMEKNRLRLFEAVQAFLDEAKRS
jgi:hypothetical protein